MRSEAGLALAVFLAGAWAQSPPIRPAFEAFEVATIKPTAPDNHGGRFITMQGAHRFIAKDYSLKALIGAAYNLTPPSISGGPAWIDSDHFDLLAETPGQVRPELDDQMAMLRKLLAERFSLTFHREPKEMSVYTLSVTAGGPKLQSPQTPDGPPRLVNVVYPDRILLPARNATMAQFASMMQRAVVDRPVMDKTGLSGNYDFNLEWTPDETQFAGQLPPVTGEITKPDLFAALRQQLGLKLEAARGTVQVLVIDRAERPSDN
ncbi:MAG: TIGR03435 family protein [Acidobacteriota bacterium]|nr:TIGR03435 family protein [Acidobacteriota bacterium]